MSPTRNPRFEWRVPGQAHVVGGPDRLRAAAAHAAVANSCSLRASVRIRLLSLARQLKYRTSTSAAAAGGTKADTPARTAGDNQVVNRATSGAPILSTTIVSVRTLQIFIFRSFLAEGSRTGARANRPTVIRAHSSQGKLRATETPLKTPEAVRKFISVRSLISFCNHQDEWGRGLAALQG